MMPRRKRCPFCRRLFVSEPRVKERQQTCGRQSCRRERKRQIGAQWRARHPDYFRGMYPQQKQAYGTRAEYKRRYRSQNPEYVRRNAAFVKKSRTRRKNTDADPVSPTSRDLRLSVWCQKGNVSIAQVSHTSRDIFVTVCENGR
jgi:hypothetical protein